MPSQHHKQIDTLLRLILSLSKGVFIVVTRLLPRFGGDRRDDPLLLEMRLENVFFNVLPIMSPLAVSTMFNSSPIALSLQPSLSPDTSAFKRMRAFVSNCAGRLPERNSDAK